MSSNNSEQNGEVTIGHVLSRSLKQSVPPGTHSTTRDSTPERLLNYHNSFEYFASLTYNLCLGEERDYSNYTPTSATSKSSIPQTVNWHSIPFEVREKIYHEYFATSTYTIHDPATCNCSVWASQAHKDSFWKYPKPLSTTTHSNQTNLFLASPEIIHEAHPVWLANSSFHFGHCILEDSARLSRVKNPVSRFASIRKIELSSADFNKTITALMVFKKRLGLNAGEAPYFKVTFRRDKIQFRLLWDRMVMAPPPVVSPSNSRIYLTRAEVELRTKALDGVRIEFTHDW